MKGAYMAYRDWFSALRTEASAAGRAGVDLDKAKAKAKSEKKHADEKAAKEDSLGDFRQWLDPSN
jgi:hypothetical protein